MKNENRLFAILVFAKQNTKLGFCILIDKHRIHQFTSLLVDYILLFVMIVTNNDLSNPRKISEINLCD